jgi:2-methylcitrate dehydratase
MLAREGMTGPSEPFEGKHGLWDKVTGPFSITLPASPDGRMIVQMSNIKAYPAESHSQALLGVIPQIRAWTTVGDIESIDIETYRAAYTEIGSHPAKWDPQNRETADHSLPYLLAVALVDGEITLSSFEQERILDPTLRPLMQRITVHENPEFTKAYPSPPRARIAVRTKSGRDWVNEVTYAKGHVMNPMTKDEIHAKYDRICAGLVSNEVRDRIRAACSNMVSVRDIEDPISALADFGRRGTAAANA